MTNLLYKPSIQSSCRHRITPESAGWKYIGFEIHHLKPGQDIHGQDADRENLLVWVTGTGRISVAGKVMGDLGGRKSVFASEKPWSTYVPRQTPWRIEATTDLVLAVCSAPSTAPDGETYPFRILEPASIERVVRGVGGNTRYINPILMDDKPWAEYLLVTEVITPSSHWSSYPSHRHDEDDFPRVTLLEEVYYHRFSKETGFGYQRIYTDRDATGKRALDSACTIEDGDVVLVPYGYHPCGAAYGYDLYYLNVMAGPKRHWRFVNDPDHDWIAQRDAEATAKDHPPAV